MSLDVYLEGPNARDYFETIARLARKPEAGVAATLDRIAALAEEGLGLEDLNPHTIFSVNITHNLNSMASEAGIYEPLWRPEEVGIRKASQLIPLLQAGLALLRSDPPRFEAHSPPNGWGNYPALVNFVENYLEACKRHPEASVRVSR